MTTNLATPSHEELIAAGKRAVAAGDMASAEEIASLLPDIMDLGESSTQALETPSTTPESDMLDKMLQSIQDSRARQSQTVDSMRGVDDWSERPLYSPPQKIEALKNHPIYSDIVNPLDAAKNVMGQVEGVAQMVGSEGRAVGEIGAELVTAVASAVTPDAAKEALGKLGKQLMATEVGQYALDAAKWGGEKWTQFAKEYPQGAKSLSLLPELAALAYPAKTPTLPGPTSLKHKGVTLKRKAQVQRRQQRVTDTTQLLEEDASKTMGKVDVDNFWGSETITPSAYDTEMASVVADVKKVTPHKSHRFNQSRVEEASVKAAKAVDEAIIAAGNPPVPHNRIYAAADKVIQRLEDHPLLVGKAQESALKVWAIARKLLEEHDGTALGLMQVRRELDQRLKRLTGDGYMEGHGHMDIAAREIRGMLNQLVTEAAPDAKTPRLLRRNHMLLAARDRLKAEADRRGKTTFSRLLGTLRDHTGVHMPTTPVALAALASVGQAAAGGSAGAVAGTMAGTTAGLWFVGAALKSPETKKFLSFLLKQTDEAIRSAKGGTLQQLKADRLVVLDYIRAAQEATQEEE